MIVKASSNRDTRWSKGKPKAVYSRSFQPAPRPSTSRPPEIASTVAAILASIAGAWKLVDATKGPSSTRDGDRGEGGERGPHLPRAAGHPTRKVVEQVVAEPDRVETDVLGRTGHGEQLGPLDAPLDLGELDADPEGACAGSRGAARGRRLACGGRASILACGRAGGPRAPAERAQRHTATASR